VVFWPLSTDFLPEYSLGCLNLGTAILTLDL
jgi:hypothetical protein